MLRLVLEKPGLQGGQRVFTPEAGSVTAPSRSSLQIFGWAHLYMSWVCRNGSRTAQPVPLHIFRRVYLGGGETRGYLESTSSVGTFVLVTDVPPAPGPVLARGGAQCGRAECMSTGCRGAYLVRTRVMGVGPPLSREEALIPTRNLIAARATEAAAGKTPEHHRH